MSWLTNLRTLVFARRGVIALESISDSLKTLAHIAQDTWDAEHVSRKPLPGDRGFSIGTLDTSAAEVKWLIDLGNRYGVDVTSLNDAEISALIDADRQRRH